MTGKRRRTRRRQKRRTRMPRSRQRKNCEDRRALTGSGRVMPPPTWRVGPAGAGKGGGMKGPSSTAPSRWQPIGAALASRGVYGKGLPQARADDSWDDWPPAPSGPRGLQPPARALPAVDEESFWDDMPAELAAEMYDFDDDASGGFGRESREDAKKGWGGDDARQGWREDDDQRGWGGDDDRDTWAAEERSSERRTSWSSDDRRSSAPIGAPPRPMRPRDEGLLQLLGGH